MDLSRRDAIRLGLFAGSALAGGCAGPLQKLVRSDIPEDVSLPKGPAEPSLRLANRLGFGPTPGELARIGALGRKGYVDEQLDSGRGEDAYLTLMLHRLDALRLDAAELQDLPEDTVHQQLQQAAILRAVYGRNQLLERMCDLWTNHFNVYARKAEGVYKKPAEEANVLRVHALGKFPDLLRASARSPAMLMYLDNQENRAGVPNENYARELLELHTLGVDGGYEYKDIKELARCLTGWTVEDRFLRPWGKFRFDPDRHDDGSKSVLGQRIPAGGGERDVEAVLDILAKHPSTAKYISKKICRHFMGDAWQAWAPRMAKTFESSGGDVREMLRPMLLSEELIDGPPILKRPFDFLVSALRCVDAGTDGGPPLLRHLKEMGQPLYEWPMPDGYPDKAGAWTGSMLARWNFALALGSGGIAGTSIEPDRLLEKARSDAPRALAEISFGRKLGEGEPIERLLAEGSFSRSRQGAKNQSDSLSRSRQGAKGTELGRAVALCLASPEFQWR